MAQPLSNHCPLTEFRGLSGSQKQKAVREATGMARESLSGQALDSARVTLNVDFSEISRNAFCYEKVHRASNIY